MIDFEKAQIKMENHKKYLEQIRNTKLKNKPNIVLVFVDDMGHGDISCYQHTAIQTPNIDKMAEEGIKMEDFYASSPVCSPSRYSVLTGRYPNRGFVNYVFFPTTGNSERKEIDEMLNNMFFPYGIRGILPDEITLAEVLNQVGYKTGIFGKWHLGDTSPYLPNERGFEYFFGSYYSNDMKPYAYYRNDQIAIPAPADQTKLTKILTNEITGFIEESVKQDNPFFVYYPSPFPHDPVHASPDFQGRSKAGEYGDCVEEIDWSVGQINNALKKLGVENDTLVIFTSDNGPWHEGNPGFHRGRKGQTWDGGQIVPFVAKWPKYITPGIVTKEAAMNIDIFPTIINHLGITPPKDRIIDGVDIFDLITKKDQKSPHDYLHFIKKDISMGIRQNDFKYEVKQTSDNAEYKNKDWLYGPFLFDLKLDQNESYSLNSRYPNKVNEFQSEVDEFNKSYKDNPRGWK